MASLNFSDGTQNYHRDSLKNVCTDIEHLKSHSILYLLYCSGSEYNEWGHQEQQYYKGIVEEGRHPLRDSLHHSTWQSVMGILSDWTSRTPARK